MKANEVRTVLMLDAELRKRARILGIENGTTLVGIVRKALQDYVHEHANKEKPLKRLNR